MQRHEIETAVSRALAETPITDIHTHLFSPPFGELLLWGPDELLTYHYLIAETFRWVDLPYEAYWRLSKKEQADLIWRTLFLEHTPISEACRGVLTVWNRLGIDLSRRNLDDVRAVFAEMDVHTAIDRILAVSGVERLAMTNDPFDPVERAVWERGFEVDPRFMAVLRLDPLLNDYAATHKQLSAWGYAVDAQLSDGALAEVRRFLTDWIKRMDPLYMAVSLPPDFAYPDAGARGRLIDEAIIPVSREFNVPFAMMIGVKRQINPQLKSAGDAGAKADIGALERLCARFPHNKFLCTMLSRENQHELAVTARKFRNLLVFGCWWFLNNPSLIEEITRFRFELLGLSVIPQHSDARILDQLVYKWTHSKRIIAQVLIDKYADVAGAGWPLSEAEIRRDAADLLGGAFWAFKERSL
ncbi:MAG TPA: glucuronate isomerase [Limnochordia bacterium]|nr:glucuronate isomerase [Limnochordia bacterium]